MPPKFRIGPGNYFLVVNTHSLHNLHRSIASSICNVGTTMETFTVQLQLLNVGGPLQWYCFVNIYSPW